jgi:hypothetical protein
MRKNPSWPRTFYCPLQLTQQSRGRSFPIIQKGIKTLIKLEEYKDKSKTKFDSHQQTIKWCFDKKSARKKGFLDW